jgi:uncharacterized membrane protein YccC
MRLEPDEQRARLEVARYSSMGHYLGAWLVAFGTPTILVLYAFSRDEPVGMLIALALLLALSLWQSWAGIRSNRALNRLLSRYEKTLAQQRVAPDDGPEAH